MSQSFIKAQAEARSKAWEEAKALLDTAASEKRDLTAEEQDKFDRINKDLDERAAAIETIRKAEEREAKAAAATSGFEVAEVTKSDYDYVRALAKGEIRSHAFETRGTLTPSGSSGLVPQSFVARVYDLAREVGPMLDVSDRFDTQSGEDLKIPVLLLTALLDLRPQVRRLTRANLLSHPLPCRHTNTLSWCRWLVSLSMMREWILQKFSHARPVTQLVMQ